MPNRPLLAILAIAALSLGGCSATVEPTPTPSVAAVEKPAGDPTPPGERCGAPADSTSLWLESSGAFFDVGLVGAGETTVIFTHQNNQDSCGFWDYALELAPLGVRSMLLNLCGYGETVCAENVTEPITTGVPAVLAAADWARANGAARIVSVGASMGGSIAIAAAASDGGNGTLDAVADLSAPLDYGGFEILPLAPDVMIPAFLAVSDDDNVISPDELVELGEALGSDDVTIFTDGLGHGWFLLRDPSGAATPIAAALTQFILGMPQ